MVLFCGQCVSFAFGVHCTGSQGEISGQTRVAADTTEPPKTCLCDVWQAPILTVFAFKGFKRGGTSRLVFAEACDSKFRHASELLNLQSASEVLHGTFVSFIVCVFFLFGVQCKGRTRPDVWRDTCCRRSDV